MSTKVLDPKAIAELLAVNPADETTWTQAMREGAQHERTTSCIGGSEYEDGPEGDAQRKFEILYESLKERHMGLRHWLFAAVDTIQKGYERGSREFELLGKIGDGVMDLELEVLRACVHILPELGRLYKAPNEMVEILRARVSESLADVPAVV
jgi:hypothetical protein